MDPSRVTVCAPSDSASRSVSMRRLRARSPSFSSAGVSTETTEPFGVQRIGEAFAYAHQLFGLVVGCDRDQEPVAREPGARRAFVRRVARAPRRRRDRPCGAARSRAARSGCPCGRSSAAVRPARDIDLAGLQPREQFVGRDVDQHHLVGLVEHRSGTVSCTRTPVMPATTSFRLSRCCTLSVVQTSMPASSSSSTSCQRLGWRGRGAPRELECASSSTSSAAGLRASAASRSNSRRDRVAVAHLAQRQLLEAVEQRRGLAAAMRLDDADHHVRAGCARARAPPPAWRRSCRRRPWRRSRCAAGRARRALRRAARRRAARRGRDVRKRSSAAVWPCQ